MNRFLVVGFELFKTCYDALILCKAKDDRNLYQITVMNGDLEKLLYGNHIIKEINGCLQIEISENKGQEILKTKIAKALSKILEIPFKIISNSHNENR